MPTGADFSLYRIHADEETTVGKLFARDDFLCYTLEDTVRFAYGEQKIAGETAIPARMYNLQLHPRSSKMERYVARFGEVQQAGMILLQDVPEFEGVLIHCGINQGHTRGCILVGEQAHMTMGEATLSGSYAAYRRVYPLIAGRMKERQRDGARASLCVVNAFGDYDRRG